MKVLKYLQLPFLFNAGLMLREVEILADLHWRPHYQVKHYEGEWSAIPLRSIDGKSDNIIISPSNDKEYGDTEFLERSPYFTNILHSFKCKLQAVRLLKLNAGSSIKEHRDADLNYEKGEVRFHIPVITHSEVEFILDNERLYLKEGECWYMNFNLPHHINNKSSIDRIHLVIDAVVNDWVIDLFNDADCPIKKEIEDTSSKFNVATTNQIIQNLLEMNTETSIKIANDLAKSL